MSSAGRKLEAEVTRVLVDAGASVLAKGMNGGGHKTVTFSYRGNEKTFHYPSSPRANGHGQRNVLARLRWALDEVKALPPRDLPAPPPAPIVRDLPVEPTPPKNAKLTPSRRKEIAKRYLQVESIGEIMSEYDLGRTQAQTLLLGTKGQAAEKLRKEINKERAEAGRKTRRNGPFKLKRNPKLKDPVERAKLAKQAFELYFTKQFSMHATAKQLNVAVRTAEKLVQEV